MSCNDNFDESSYEILTPPLNISIQQLVSSDYTKIDSLNILAKRYGDVSVSYYFLNDYTPVFTRSVTLLDIDSASVNNWVKNNGGVIRSEWNNLDNGGYVFFVLEKNTGLILESIYKEKVLNINFEYPDLGNNNRSSLRHINECGQVVIEGLNNKKQKVIIKPFHGSFKCVNDK